MYSLYLAFQVQSSHGRPISKSKTHHYEAAEGQDQKSLIKLLNSTAAVSMCAMCIPFWHLEGSKIPVDSHQPFSPALIYTFPIFVTRMAGPSFLVSVQRLRQPFGIRLQCLTTLFCWVGHWPNLCHPSAVCETKPATIQNSTDFSINDGERRNEKNERKREEKHQKTISDCISCLVDCVCTSNGCVGMGM